MKQTRSLSIFLACLSLLPLVCARLSAEDYGVRVLELVNAERTKAEAPPLTANPQLAESARRYAQYLGEAGFFSHIGPDGSTLVTRNLAAGYRDAVWLGENIAAGYWSPDSAVAAWMDSPPHRSNILDPNFAEIGVSTVFVACSPFGRYWALEFGRRNGTRLSQVKTSDKPSRPVPGGRDLTATDHYSAMSSRGVLGQTSGAAPESARGALPEIAGVSPSSASHGAAVTVVGHGFGDSGLLRFGGLVAKVNLWTDTKIVGCVPDGAISAGVTVTNNSGAISLGSGFLVASP